MLLVAGCAAGTTAVTVDPAAEQNLAKETAQRAELEQKWAATAPDIRKECDLKVGECSMDVKDKRHDLIRRRSFPGCGAHIEEAAKVKCEDEAMLELGEGDAVIEYYAFGNWCLKGLIDCAAKLEQEAAAAALDQEIRGREHLVLETPIAVRWRENVAIAEEKVKYLRSTLPPKGDAICQEEAKRDDCLAKVTPLEKKLEAYLQTAEGYKQVEAVTLYRKAREQEASCYQPEFDCIDSKLEKYAATDRTRGLLKRNLDVIEQRERLETTVPDQVVERCLLQGAAQHQDQVIMSYRQYAKQTVLFFRLQLHKAFLAVHEAQVQCLQQGGQ
jgi:hypothetical protein